MNDFEYRLKTRDEMTSINFIVQAGFVLKTKKCTTMGVDLYLTDCVERFDGFKRLSPKIMSPETPLDYIVATHWHLDHFDIDAMPLLLSNRNTRLLCTEDCKKHIYNLGLDEKRITYIKVGDSIKCSDITVNAVFCDHGEGAPLAVGLVLETDGFKIYLAGDTSLRLDKAPEVAKHGPFDIMMAPINGAFGNLNESENVKLCEFHRPKLSIPCHYWTFAEQHGDPGLWIDLMREKLPGQKYSILAPGEQLILDMI